MSKGFKGLKVTKRIALRFVAGFIGATVAFTLLAVSRWLGLELSQFIEGVSVMYLVFVIGDPIYDKLIRKYA